MTTIYSNAYVREDYEIKGMYRLMTYSSLRGYWSTSELMTKEEAESLLFLYGEE